MHGGSFMQTIILRDHGVLPGEDCTLKLHALTEQYKEDTTFVFEDADYIYLLDKGRIIEKGTHQELINLNSEYKRIHDENKKEL